MIKFFIKLCFYFALSFSLLSIKSGNETLFSKLDRKITPYKKDMRVFTLNAYEKIKQAGKDLFFKEKK